MNLPAAAPAPVLEPHHGNLLPRSCPRCEVTWFGTENDTCWCCDDVGADGMIRLTSYRRPTTY